MKAEREAALPAMRYGTPTTCRLFQAGGLRAVASGGGSIGLAVEIPDGEGYLLVTKSDVVGLEWGCHPASTTLGAVRLSCTGEGEEWLLDATITVNGDTLTYADEDGAIELQPCRLE
jgi:hypothetical protein